jgi:hypothetical protein
MRSCIGEASLGRARPVGASRGADATGYPGGFDAHAGIRLRHPLGVELGGAVDRGQAQRFAPGVGEAVGDVGRSDHDLPAANHHRVVAEPDAGLARFDHEHLGGASLLSGCVVGVVGAGEDRAGAAGDAVIAGLSGAPAWALQLAVMPGVQASGGRDGRWPGRRVRLDGRTSLQ